MLKKSIITFILSFSLALAFGQNEAYKLYNAKGVEVQYEDMVNQLVKNDLVFFGELHNDPICHWLEYRLLKDVTNLTSQKPTVGAEMFESDDQLILNEYLNGIIQDKHFQKEAKIWSNYQTDYKPLVEFAKSEKIKFVATNIPRRYAALVSRKGFEGLDTLSSKALNYIAPLPVKYNPELAGYKKMLEMSHLPGMKNHTNENLPKAQAIKDATMAHFILENYQEGSIFIHYNGTYHSNNKEGIIWYINQKNADLKVASIATVKQEDIRKLKDKNTGLADYILVVPSDMTTTY
jgi:uncharacterized iron-regulated protein